MRVGVFGIGHVGLPTAATLAHFGHDVVALDADREKIDELKAGKLPFFEPGLEQLVNDAAASDRLVFSHEPSDALSDAQIAFICVGTPPRASGEANLLAVEKVAGTIAQHATGPLVVVQKSTVPAGTSRRVAQVLGRQDDERFMVASNPEFLREGKAVEDSLHPTRILVGSESKDALALLKDLYAPQIEAGARWIATDVETAELAKHACNAFLAMKISFANALARICDLAGADVVQVADAMGSDERIGRAFLNAGLGYGGYCFPKDLAAFEKLAGRLGYDFALLREVARINDEAVEFAFKRIEEVLWNLESKRVVLLGLSFKPETDDVRFSPALALARRLIGAGVHVVGYDPEAASTAKSEMPELDIAPDPYTALAGAHCAVLCTEWDEFLELDLERARTAMAEPVVIDGRNVLDPAAMEAAGFTYLATGRPSVWSGDTPA